MVDDDRGWRSPGCAVVGGIVGAFLTIMGAVVIWADGLSAGSLIGLAYLAFGLLLLYVPVDTVIARRRENRAARQDWEQYWEKYQSEMQAKEGAMPEDKDKRWGKAKKVSVHIPGIGFIVLLWAKFLPDEPPIQHLSSLLQSYPDTTHFVLGKQQYEELREGVRQAYLHVSGKTQESLAQLIESNSSLDLERHRELLRLTDELEETLMLIDLSAEPVEEEGEV